VPAELKLGMRAAFKGVFILAGGFDRGRAERALDAGEADLIAFARPFIANPDLPARLRADAALNPLDMATFYTPGLKGYTDYPMLNA
jgi:N-ethylmaleimide reductase